MRTNYKDYVPTTELRKYTMVNNDDGTISLRDATTYEQEGDKLSAGVLNELSQNANWPLAHTKTDTVHALAGLSGASGTLSCVFTASAAYAKGDTFTVDGESYTVKLQSGEEADDNLFAEGAKVGVIIDTEEKSVNFKSGGGLSASKLQLATATEADVLIGKTFYGGDNKELRTGALVEKSLKYASGEQTYTYSMSSSGLTVSNLGFKPYVVIIYQKLSGSYGIPSFHALNAAGSKVISFQAKRNYSSYMEILSTTANSVTANGFTLKFGANDSYWVDGSTAAWHAWGI